MDAIRRIAGIQPKILFRAGIIFYCLFTIAIRNLPFYGDHVSTISAPANYFYDSGFKTLILPDSLNTGHPPFYALFHACAWKLFGRHLLVSHFITLVAVLFLFVQYFRLSKKILTEGPQRLALLFFILQPTVLAQISLMSSDILLCGLFLFGLNSILSDKRKMLMLAVCFLLLVSLRGIMLSGLLFIGDLLWNRNLKQHPLKYILHYVVASIPVLLWFGFHYVQTGWAILNPDSPWARGKEFVSMATFPGKLFEYILRYAEFGMIIPWLFVLMRYAKIKNEIATGKYVTFLLSGILFFSLFIIFFKNPVMVRYILPLQFICLILFSKAITLFSSKPLKTAVILFAVIFFTAQHFFAYPQMRSSIFEYSWGEGSLAHVAYFKFRQEGSDYLRAMGISPSDVYTGFPEYKNFNDTNLDKERNIPYRPLVENELRTYPYVIWSNLMNGISKDTELELKQHWIPLQSFSGYPVEYIIFKNPGDY